jgi:hypothetical protein
MDLESKLEISKDGDDESFGDNSNKAVRHTPGALMSHCAAVTTAAYDGTRCSTLLPDLNHDSLPL